MRHACRRTFLKSRDERDDPSDRRVCRSRFRPRNRDIESVVFDRCARAAQNALKPMALGLMIQPATGAEAAISRVKELGFSNCFLSLDGYLGKFSESLAQELRGLLDKYGVVATSVEVVGPGRLVWDFLDGPSTIGLVPRESRSARIDALKQTSDFAKLLGVPRVQTHCGFIPENPRDSLYEEAVLAIREVAMHCAANGQDFLMETGQETPTTMKRAIQDVDQPNLGVGLDTANLILYGKANPVDAVDMIGAAREERSCERRQVADGSNEAWVKRC